MLYGDITEYADADTVDVVDTCDRPAPASVFPLRRSYDQPAPMRAAPDEFVLIRGQVLLGRRLAHVKTLQGSIERFGLLAPIVAVRAGGRLVVLDGRKRLAAIRRLAFLGRLPASLKTVPYVLASGSRAPTHRDASTPAMLRSRALFAAVMQRFRAGAPLDGIAADLHISRRCVRDVLALARLDEAVRRSLFERLISVVQAQAFATIPDMTRQRRVLMQLGPFADPEDICAAGRIAEPRQRCTA